MFPILPLLFVILGTALTADEQDSSITSEAQGTSTDAHRLGRRLFWCVNTIGLVACSLSDAQRNWTVPLLRIARQTPKGVYRHLVVIEPDVVPAYYLDGRASWEGFASVTSFYDAALQKGMQLDYVLLRALPDAEGMAKLKALGCSAPERFEGDAVDRLLVYVNRHNQRRAATTLLRCTQAALAAPDKKA